VTPHGDAVPSGNPDAALASERSEHLFFQRKRFYDGERNFSQSLVKLGPDLQVSTWFTPQD